MEREFSRLHAAYTTRPVVFGSRCRQLSLFGAQKFSSMCAIQPRSSRARESLSEAGRRPLAEMGTRVTSSSKVLFALDSSGPAICKPHIRSLANLKHDVSTPSKMPGAMPAFPVDESNKDGASFFAFFHLMKADHARAVVRMPLSFGGGAMLRSNRGDRAMPYGVPGLSMRHATNLGCSRFACKPRPMSIAAWSGLPVSQAGKTAIVFERLPLADVLLPSDTAGRDLLRMALEGNRLRRLIVRSFIAGHHADACTPPVLIDASGPGLGRCAPCCFVC
ncbi:hypothetical protein NB688_002825 [Xanthomonas sacchari]|uniref:Uncharacterized protein n=1 Tax=Xanthomonas sacchari TaxID=56458 RepID=A0ABT3DWE4_9XANT|nr:hypothetical protein [Xanthomonas sacchari]MCW0420659.1 hypothetical protein [Xanthomonas sacchari]